MSTSKELEELLVGYGVKKGAVSEVVGVVLDNIVKSAQDTGRWAYKSHVFKKVSRAARTARNIKTGEKIEVPPKTLIKYTNKKTVTLV